MNTLIKNYMTEKVEAEERTNYRGFCPLHDYTMIKVPENFKIVSHWCYYPYRVVWVNEKELSVLTYVEGDLFLSVFKTQEAFKNDIVRSEEFYKEN